MFDFLFDLCIYLKYLLFFFLKNLLYVLSLAVTQQTPRHNSLYVWMLGNKSDSDYDPTIT